MKRIGVMVAMVGCGPKANPDAASVLQPESTAAQISSPDKDAIARALDDGDGNGEMWTVVHEAGFSIAVPDGWVAYSAPDAGFRMLRIGDGIGLPTEDEYGAPLQAGVAVETRDEPANPNELADLQVEQLQTDPAVAITFEPFRHTVVLCDGRDAEFLLVGFARPDERRKSIFAQVYSVDDDGHPWVSSGYFITGLHSAVTDAESLATTWIAAHALSLCISPGEFSDTGIRAAYRALDDAVDRHSGV